jgi:hypothetical protein
MLIGEGETLIGESHSYKLLIARFDLIQQPHSTAREGYGTVRSEIVRIACLPIDGRWSMCVRRGKAKCEDHAFRQTKEPTNRGGGQCKMMLLLRPRPHYLDVHDGVLD